MDEPTTTKPSSDELRQMLFGDIDSRAIDGCGPVEPDGECEHGCPAWPVYLEMI